MFGGYEYEDLGNVEMFEQLLPLVKPGRKVLDLGIGGGHPSAPLAFSGLLVTGVDSDRYQLERCLASYKEAGMSDQLVTVCSDALNFLETCTDKFDVVFMSDFLMFIKKTPSKQILKLAYTTLAPSGLMWIQTTSTTDERYEFFANSHDPIDEETFMAYSHCHGNTPFCFYKPGEIDGFLKLHGAKIIFSAEIESSVGSILNAVLVQMPD